MSFEAVRNYSTNNNAVIAPDNELKVEQLIKSRLVGISHWATHARVAVAAHAGHDNSLVVKFAQEYVNSHRIFDNLRFLKDFWQFRSSQN